jgi:hypothetical protein
VVGGAEHSINSGSPAMRSAESIESFELLNSGQKSRAAQVKMSIEARNGLILLCRFVLEVVQGWELGRPLVLA